MKKMIKRLWSSICIISILLSCFAYTASAAPTGPISLLSGNNIYALPSDKVLYPIESNPSISTGATYEWVNDATTDAALQANDLDTDLTDGAVTNLDANATTNGTWSSYKNGIAVFDLKKDYYVSKVDVWSFYQLSSLNKMSQFDVLAKAEDEADFTLVATAVNDNTTNATIAATVAIFTPVKARYVKVIMYNAPSSKMLKIGEVLIFGQQDDTPVADKTKLSALIAVAEKYNQSAFKPTNWNSFLSAFQVAKTIAADSNPTVSEVETAYNTLRTAMDSLETIYETGILSNNVLSGVDLNEYPDTIRRIKTTSSYRFLGTNATDDQFRANDTTIPSKLTNGGVTNLDGNATTNNSWGRATATVLFRFDKPYYISGVDIWTLFMGTGNKRGMKDFDVEVSMEENGTYEKVCTAVNEKNIPENENTMVKTSSKFAPSKARYVKLTIRDIEGNYQLKLGEVIIFGYELPPTLNFDYESVTYHDVNNDPLLTLNGATTIMVNPVVCNNTEFDKELTVIAVIYDDVKSVVKINVQTKNVPKDGTESFEATFTDLPQAINNNYSVKTYVWDNLTDCKPVIAAKTFKPIN